MSEAANGWKAISLGKLTVPGRDIVYGIVQAGPNVPGGIPYIRSTDVGAKLVVESLLRTTPTTAKKYKRSEVKAGDIVFSLRGNIGEMSIVPPELEGANLTQGTARIAVKDGYLNEFIAYALSAYTIRKRINAAAKGSTFREITLEDLRKVEVAVPRLPEQRQIAAVLGTWDRALAGLENLLAAKQQRKQALMQQLLTGKKRFKRFAGSEWKTPAIREILEVRDTLLPKGVDLPLYSLTIENGVTAKTDRYDREALVKNTAEKKYKLVKPDDIVFNPSNLRWGAIARYRGQRPVLVSPIYEVLSLKDASRFSLGFVEQVLTSPRQIAKFATMVEGGLVERLAVKVDVFLAAHVAAPVELAEQEGIGEFFKNCDLELALLEREAAALRDQKKGLMQQLLTGKVRVKG